MLDLSYQIVVSGIIATSAMIVFMWGITWTGFANGDMVRALGSLYTHNYNNALKPGLVMQFTGGILFSILYFAIWRALDPNDMILYIFTGILFGFTHGFIVSFSMIIAIAEFHPVEQFRKAGIKVAIIHILGHMIYGGVLGLMAWSFIAA